MIGKPGCFHADVALITVSMLISAADAADAALVAMVLPLVLVVQKNTNRTPIIAHDYIALFADLASLLNERTLHTSHGLNGMPIHRVASLHILFVFVLDLVMAEPAIKELITTGS